MKQDTEKTDRERIKKEGPGVNLLHKLNNEKDVKIPPKNLTEVQKVCMMRVTPRLHSCISSSLLCPRHHVEDDVKTIQRRINNMSSKNKKEAVKEMQEETHKTDDDALDWTSFSSSPKNLERLLREISSRISQPLTDPRRRMSASKTHTS